MTATAEVTAQQIVTRARLDAQALADRQYAAADLAEESFAEDWRNRYGSDPPSCAVELMRESAKAEAAIDYDMERYDRRPSNSPYRLMQWVACELADRGYRAASDDVRRETVGKYARLIASDYLATAPLPISAALHGEAEQNYWRAIAIAKAFREGWV
jgi:hypothetical protein